MNPLVGEHGIIWTMPVGSLRESCKLFKDPQTRVCYENE